MNESKIVNAILDELQRGCWPGFFYPVRNVGIFDKNFGGYRKNSRQVNGIPDIEGVVPPGRYVGIEVKTDKGRQSKSQIAFQKKVEEVGGIYIVARSVAETLDKLKPFWEM